MCLKKEKKRKKSKISWIVTKDERHWLTSVKNLKKKQTKKTVFLQIELQNDTKWNESAVLKNRPQTTILNVELAEIAL